MQNLLTLARADEKKKMTDPEHLSVGDSICITNPNNEDELYKYARKVPQSIAITLDKAAPC